MGMEDKNINHGLNTKQLKFCVEYAKDCNATQAAIRAGYTEKSAYSTSSRMLRNDKVKAYIAQLTAKHMADAEISIDWVLKQAKEIIEACTKPDDNGKIDATGANGSLKIISKYLGMDRQKVEHSGTVEGFQLIVKRADDKPSDSDDIDD